LNIKGKFLILIICHPIWIVIQTSNVWKYGVKVSYF